MRTIGLAILLTSVSVACAPSAATSGPLPKPERDVPGPPDPKETRALVLAGGCFWCVEAVFENLAGVTEVVSGYAGGAAAHAHYEQVSAGETGHAEAVRITYHPSSISFGTLLRVFFTTHNPTQLNRQGPDWGRQYRSAIFYGNDQERAVAQAYIQQLNEAKVFEKPIVTTLEPLQKFYPAEDYHQDFVARHPNHPYVRAWVPAKLKKLRAEFRQVLKPE